MSKNAQRNTLVQEITPENERGQVGKVNKS